MKKLIFLTIVFAFVSSFSGFSQTGNQIELKKKRYYQNDKQLNNKELKAILKSEPESAAALKKSRNIVTTGYILDGATAAVLVATVGVLPAVLGGVLVATPFIIVSNKHLKKSVEIYNSKHGVVNPPELAK